MNGLGLPVRKKRNFKNLQLAPQSTELLKVESNTESSIGDESTSSKSDKDKDVSNKENNVTNTVNKEADDLSHKIASMDPFGERELKSDDLVFVDELGSGNGGTVCKVKHEPSDQIMAKKTVLIEAQSPIRRQILRELQILHHCHSDYIINFYGAFLQDPHICMCMEFMDKGSLDRIIRKHGPVSCEIFGKIALSVLRGLTYLYDVHRIIHRDVKPSNILVNSKGQIKLCDFGVSGELINSIADTFVGTSTYMSPERIQGAQYTVKSDVWSLGITLVELALGKFPFSENDGDDEENDKEDEVFSATMYPTTIADDDGSVTLDANATLSPLNTGVGRARATSRAGRTIGVTQGVSTKNALDNNQKEKKEKKVGVSVEGKGPMMSILDLLQHIVNEPAPKLPKNKKYPKEAHEFIGNCLDKDVNVRQTPKKLLDHKFIKQVEKLEINLELWSKCL